MYKIKDITNTIIHGNSLDILREFPSNSVDCFVTSSPYFGLRSYGTVPQVWGGDRNCNHVWEYGIKAGISGGTKSKKVNVKGVSNYQITPDTTHATCLKCGAWLGELGQEPTHILFIEHLTEIFMECARILTPTGSMWINISDTYAANRTYQVTGTKQVDGSQPTKYKQPQAKDMGITPKSLVGIPDRIKLSLIDRGLICRNQIIWYKPNQMPSSAKDRFTNDYEMMYFFTKSEKYFFQQQFEPCSDSANKKRNMRTVWPINTQPNKVAHFATFPESLPERCVLAGCPEGGVVVDPFFGSGTTGVVARRNNRNWIGIDLNEEYINIAKERLDL